MTANTLLFYAKYLYNYRQNAIYRKLAKKHGTKPSVIFRLLHGKTIRSTRESEILHAMKDEIRIQG